MEYIVFVLFNLLIDYYISLFVKNYFNLSVKKLELFFLQIFNLASVIIYIFCGINLLVFILIKMLVSVIVSLLITDNYKFVEICKIEFFYLFLMFSIFGLCEFFELMFEACLNQIFDIKIAKYLHFISKICIFMLFYSYFCIFSNFNKNKMLNNFLFNVSLFLYGKHIEITGFLDSGNSLHDTKTGKPIIVISSKVLKKYFDYFDYETATKSGFCTHTVKCEVGGGFKLLMPVVEIGKVMISKQGQITKTYDCVLGVVKQKFCESKKYDCLLNRDFV